MLNQNCKTFVTQKYCLHLTSAKAETWLQDFEW